MGREKGCKEKKEEDEKRKQEKRKEGREKRGRTGGIRKINDHFRQEAPEMDEERS